MYDPFAQDIIDNLPDFEVLGFMSLNPEIAEADRLGKGVYDIAPNAIADAKIIVGKLKELVRKE